MGQLLLFIVVALVVAAIVFGVTVMVSGGDSGLTPVEPDGKALPLPVDRPLGEEDVARSRFDTAFRGYRMSQVDQALQRAAYDIGYKNELIGVLEAEVTALRDGRTSDADALRRAREASVAPPPVTAVVTKSDTPSAADTTAPLAGVASAVASAVGDATKDVPAQASPLTAEPGEATEPVPATAAKKDDAEPAAVTATAVQKDDAESAEKPAERR